MAVSAVLVLAVAADGHVVVVVVGLAVEDCHVFLADSFAADVHFDLAELVAALIVAARHFAQPVMAAE